MARKWMLSAGVLACSLSFAQLADAQPPPWRSRGPRDVIVEAAPQTAAPEQPAAEAPVAAAPIADALPGPAPARRRPVQSCLNKLNMGCYANNDTYGCSSFRSQMMFMFGSCRSFFGEECVPNPRLRDRDRDPNSCKSCPSGKCGQ